MKVYFGCTTQRINEFKKYYKTIEEEIKLTGNVLTRRWLESAIDEASSSTELRPRSEHYNDVIDSILKCDVAIFETTVPSMGVGHQLTFALENGKPSLILNKKSVKNVNNLFISGISSNLLVLKNYESNADLKKIVSNYLVEISPKNKIRLNIVLDNDQNMYLEWAAFKYKTSKTQIIKSAIEQKIISDKLFGKSS